MKIKKSILFLLIIVLFYPFLIKYVFVQYGQYEQLLLINRFLDKNYLINDWITNVDAVFNPRFFYTLYTGSLASILSLPLTYFLNYLLMVTLLALASYKTSFLLFKNKFVSILTTIAILFSRSYTLGGNDIIGTDLDPHRLAINLVFVAFTLIFLNRYILASLLFAMAAYIHPLIGFEVPALIYFAFLLYGILRKDHKILKPIIKSFCFYVILSSVSLVFYIKTFLQNQTSYEIEQTKIFILTHITNPAHYLPSSWSLSTYIYFFGFILTAFLFLKINKKSIPDNISIIFKILIFLILILNLFTFLFTEIITVPFIITLQFFRINVIVYWLSALLVYGGLFYFGFKQREKNILAYLIFSFIPFILTRPEVILIPGPSHAVYLVLAVLLLLWLRRGKVMSIFLIVLTLLIFSIPRRHLPFHYNETYPFYTPQVGLGQWAKINTPSSAIFLTPLDLYTFRLTGERAIVVDWYVVPYGANALIEWMGRIKDVSGMTDFPYYDISQDKAIEGYRKLDIKRVNFLLTKYKFDFIVTEKETVLPLQKVYENERYNVYKSPKVI